MTGLNLKIFLVMLSMAVAGSLCGQTTAIDPPSGDRTLSILSLLLGEETDSAATELSKDGKVIDWGWLGRVDPIAELRPGALTFITEAVDGEEGYYTTGSQLPSTTLMLWKPSTASNGWSVRHKLASGRHGVITSGFGWRERFGRHHNGIDIAMSVGDTVRTPMSGTVSRIAFEARGYGNYIVIVHDDGMETRYAHLTSTLVPVGARVRAGEAIALSGNSGRSTGPHLHFEARCFGLAVDPETLFNFAGSSITPKF